MYAVILFSVIHNSYFKQLIKHLNQIFFPFFVFQIEIRMKDVTRFHLQFVCFFLCTFIPLRC